MVPLLLLYLYKKHLCEVHTIILSDSNVFTININISAPTFYLVNPATLTLEGVSFPLMIVLELSTIALIISVMFFMSKVSSSSLTL